MYLIFKIKLKIKKWTGIDILDYNRFFSNFCFYPTTPDPCLHKFKLAVKKET